MVGRTGLILVARRAMACEFSVSFPAGFRRAIEAGCAALDEVQRLEAKLSVYLQDSDLSAINRAAASGPVRSDAEVFDLLATAARLSAATAGAFDPASGALSRAWGFYRGPKRVPAESERLAALRSSGMAQVDLDPERRSVCFRRPGLELNFGAIGKGYALDAAAARLRSGFNVRAALLEAGRSSVRAIGAPPDQPRGWQIAIGDPFQPGRVVTTVWLRDAALGTSGSQFQYFTCGGRRYGHVLDPRSGCPADCVAGASAIAGTAAEADALSTAFFVMGLDATREYCRTHPGTGAVIVTKPARNQPPRVVTIGQACER